MIKRLIKALFFLMICIARIIASFVIWLMEDDTSFSKAWKDTE